MANKNNFAYEFIRVQKDEEHILALYNLLKNRRYNISNTSTPSFAEHRSFVMRHPYRFWFLIKYNFCVIGSIYFLKNNCIGIYLIDQKLDAIRHVINWALKKYKPLPAIKSVRSANFHINLAPNNKKSQKLLMNIGAVPLQITFDLGSVIGHL